MMLLYYFDIFRVHAIVREQTTPLFECLRACDAPCVSEWLAQVAVT